MNKQIKSFLWMIVIFLILFLLIFVFDSFIKEFSTDLSTDDLTTIVDKAEPDNGDHYDGSSLIPNGYYNKTKNLSGEELKATLNDIISEHDEFSYTSEKTDVWDILRVADEDPNNNDNIIMFYTGISHPKECQDTKYPPEFCAVDLYGEEKLTEWNREHIWSKSRGDFGTKRGAGTDTHHIVAAERAMNSTKNNRIFQDCNDGDDNNIIDRQYGNFTCNDWGFEPRDEVKGDVARMIFYMMVRYEGENGEVDLEVNDYILNPTKKDKDPFYGDLNDLLRWHLEDPVSEWEVNRNEIIYSFQGNRNPFIDNPKFVELIFEN